VTRKANGQFSKEHSGNPKGRPPKSTRQSVNSSDLLDKRFSVEIDGMTRELTTEEALQIRTFNAAIGGDRQAMREVVRMIRKRDAYLAKHDPSPEAVPSVTLKFNPDPDNADEALVLLDMASWQPMFEIPTGTDRKVLKLETWIAQAAVSRPNPPKLADDQLGLFKSGVRNADQVRRK
jgi:hypothetical protein